MGQVDDALVSDQPIDHEVGHAVALDGDPIALDFEDRRAGDTPLVITEGEDYLDLALVVEDAHGNAARRAPNGALMVGRAQGVHDLDEIEPGIDNLTGYSEAFRQCQCGAPDHGTEQAREGPTQ